MIHSQKKILRVIPTITFIHVVTGKSSGILSGISSGILPGISSGILPGISSGISSGISIWHIYLAYLLAFYLAYLLAFYLAVEVQRCPLSSEGPRLRSSAAHWARKVPGWGPAVPAALGTWRLRSSCAHSDRKPAVEVQQCPLRAEVGEEIGEELARRKLAKRLATSW